MHNTYTFLIYNQELAENSMSDSTLYTALIVAILLAITIAYSRFAIRKKVTKMMMIPSEADQQQKLQEKQSETAAKAKLHFNWITYETPQPEAQVLRESLISRAKKEFRLHYIYCLMIALGYMLLTMGDAVFLALPYAAIATYRILGFRDQFRAHKTGFTSFLAPFKKTFLAIADPVRAPYLDAVLILVALSHFLFSIPFIDLEELGYLAALGVHIGLLKHLQAKLAKVPNLKLLVLRVFGINDTALFTFEGLLKFWKYFGSFFTVVDPSFIRSKFRQKSETIPVVVVSFFLLIIVEVELEAASFDTQFINYFVIIPLVVLACIALVRYNLKQVSKSFIKNQEHLDARLEKLKRVPRSFDHTYKSMPTMCYDNTWKLAVATYTQLADAVLMDLRGFSEERKGCAYEVDFLFDNVAVEKVVFLIQPDTVDIVTRLIEERWEYLKVKSPNLKTKDPVITVYIANRENSRDIQAILDLVLSKTNFSLKETAVLQPA
ncbi:MULTISPECIES: hypothetical protein [unclassified Leeuwenhoekiella]|uniref:hypothetical protein n=1 Tax=unclassified Leeuwenhoekiella TaxID=2615029 RepID=UPI000C4CECA2|nr:MULTISPECIES: hypothetical protein [unclassified Leeuwenhoekiella]MAW94517.1 hypothetical protein [Leeuwenhoekiella sp.]MBA81940.1 hypothetical protein [Leeuwenhoekiella sp.]|tara:strand:- start:8160 stop:9638 length:1479 start_codon:yes stop_codon:yes gene_type:complete